MLGMRGPQSGVRIAPSPRHPIQHPTEPCYPVKVQPTRSNNSDRPPSPRLIQPVSAFLPPSRSRRLFAAALPPALGARMPCAPARLLISAGPGRAGPGQAGLLRRKRRTGMGRLCRRRRRALGCPAGRRRRCRAPARAAARRAPRAARRRRRRAHGGWAIAVVGRGGAGRWGKPGRGAVGEGIQGMEQGKRARTAWVG